MLQVYRSNLLGSSSKGGSRISSAFLHQHAMNRHGAASGSLSPSTTMSPLTMSPSSSMAIPTDHNENGTADILTGNVESGSSSRRASFYSSGNLLSKEEQADGIFKLIQRQTASALRGEKSSHTMVGTDDTSSKNKHGECNNLPTSYDVATLQFS